MSAAAGYRLTLAAEADLRQVLRSSRARFGIAHAQRYKQLLDRALAAVCQDPVRPASRPRSELGAGIRTFHIGLAAGRQRAGRHLLVYRTAGDGIVEILRVLHDSMEMMRHLPGNDEAGNV